MQSEQCIRCKHYKGNSKCKAFPENIPTEIFIGLFIHNNEYEGQKDDIVFEAI